MSKPGKLLFLFIAVLSGALAGLYVATPALAEKALKHWLQQHYSDIRLDMEPPGWNQLAIKQITLKKQETAKSLTLSSHHILITYNPFDLLLENRLDTVLLPESKITIDFQQQDTSSGNGEATRLADLLPSQWLDKVPLNALRIGELDLVLNYPENESDWRFKGSLLLENATLYSRVNFTRNQTQLGWGDLKLAADDTVQLRLLNQNQPFFTIDGQLNFDEQLSFQSKQTLTLGNLGRLAEKLSLENLSDLDGELTFTGNSLFPVSTHLTPDALLQSIQTKQSFNGHLALARPIPEVAAAELGVSGDLEFSLQALKLNLSEKSALTLSGLNHKSLQREVDKIILNLNQPVNIEALLTSGKFTPEISPLTLLLDITPIRFAQFRIRENQLKLILDNINLENGTLNGSASISQLKLEMPKQKIPAIDINSQFKIAKDTLGQQLTLATAALPLHLNATARTNLDNFSTRLDWKLKPVALNHIDRTISPFIEVPAKLAIQKGTFFHNGRATINSKGTVSATLNNSFRDINFSWDEIFFAGLNHTSRTRISPGGKLSDTGSIQLAKVITGIEITKVQSKYAYQHNKGRDLLTLEKSQAELLQGLITFSDFSFSPLKPNFRTQVRISDLDLGEVLALERQQGLSGEGKLEGVFPLRFTDNQLTITDGLLHAKKPGGRIIFTPSATVKAYSATNTGLRIAIEALGNFHYDILDIGLNYRHDGTALLKTRLKGKNPDWNQGHPVDFTINVEENIPKLMKTLQFADKLTRKIEQRYR